MKIACINLIKCLKCHIFSCIYRQRTTLKKTKTMKSVSRVKVLDFKVIFKFWRHGQQNWTLFQWLVNFAGQNLVVLRVKRPWNRLHFSCTFQCCMCSIHSFKCEKLGFKKIDIFIWHHLSSARYYFTCCC